MTWQQVNWRFLLLGDSNCTIFGHLPLQDVSSVASSVWAGCPTLPWWRPSSASQVWPSSVAVAMWHWPAPSLCWRTTSPGSPVTTLPSPWCKFKGHGLSNTQLQESRQFKFVCLCPGSRSFSTSSTASPPSSLYTPSSFWLRAFTPLAPSRRSCRVTSRPPSVDAASLLSYVNRTG